MHNKKNGTDNAIVMVFAGEQKRMPMYALQLILVVISSNRKALLIEKGEKHFTL